MKRSVKWNVRTSFPLALLCLLSFALPAQSPAQVTPTPGWLGISIADITEDLADRLGSAFGPQAGTGVVVVEVLKGGPAEGSPLRRGDVIVGVDKQPIWEVRQLQRTIRAKAINQQVMLTVLRESSRIHVPVTIGAMPVEARAQLAGERFGFLVRGDDERDTPAQPSAPADRVLIVFVDADSPAARAGLRPQDVILSANDQPIHSLEDFEQAMRRKDRVASLSVERRGTAGPIAVTLEAPAR